jgi:hypothetical protein
VIDSATAVRIVHAAALRSAALNAVAATIAAA